MSELMGIARFKFHEGKLEEFKRLSAVCMEIVRAKDPGTLQYDTFFNEDETECIVLERFRVARCDDLPDFRAALPLRPRPRRHPPGAPRMDRWTGPGRNAARQRPLR